MHAIRLPFCRPARRPDRFRISIPFDILPLLAAGVIGVAGQLSAQAPLRFDMGSSSSPVEPGWTRITETSFAPAGGGSGWKMTPGINLQSRVSQPRAATPAVVSIYPEAVLGDVVVVDTTTKFLVDGLTPQTDYLCIVHYGDLGDANGADALIRQGYPIRDVSLAANGASLTGGVARTVAFKARADLDIGGHQAFRLRSKSDAGGKITVQIRKPTGAGSSWRGYVMGIEVYRDHTPPIYFDHGAKRLDATSAYVQDSNVQRYLRAMQADDHQQARIWADQIVDPLARAWAFAWLVGWLKDDARDVPDYLADLLGTMSPAIGTWTDGVILETLALVGAPDDVRVELLDRYTRSFRYGELMLRTRGFSNDALFNPLSLNTGGRVAYAPGNNGVPARIKGEIHANINAGVTLLEQLSDDVLELVANPLLDECPFGPQAAFMVLRSLWAQNVSMAPVEPQPLITRPYLFGIRDRILARTLSGGPNAVFKDAPNAYLLSWFLDRFAPQNEIPLDPLSVVQPYDGADPGIDPDTTWWGSLLHLQPAGGSPGVWASNQRRYAKRLRAMQEWWYTQVLTNGELGSGVGDDVELPGGIPNLTLTEGPDNPVEAGVVAVMRAALESSDVDFAQGYFNQALPGDSEHTSEYTSYPLLFLSQLRPGDPYALEFAMRLAQNIEDWTAYSPVLPFPARMFKSFVFDADQVSAAAQDQTDTTQNARTLVPALILEDWNHDPTLQLLLDEYSFAWSQLAQAANVSPDGIAKKIGFFPTAAAFANPLAAMGGCAPLSSSGCPLDPASRYWYTAPLGSSSGFGKEATELYLMMLRSHRRNAPTPSGATPWLDAIVAAATSLEALLPVRMPHQPPNGADPWVGQAMSEAAGTAAFYGRRELYYAGVSTPEIQALTGSFVISAASGERGGVLRDYIDDAQPQIGTGVKDKTLVADAFSYSADYLEKLFPLSTSLVVYTDRVGIGSANAMKELYAAYGGGPFSITPNAPVSWANARPDLGELDVAILCNEAGPASMKFVIHKFSGTSLNLKMRIWRGLYPGNYTLKIGPDASPRDDWADSVQQSHNIEIRDHYLEVALDPILADGQYVLDLNWTGPVTGLTNQLVDLGVGLGDLRANGSGGFEVEVHNLGAADYVITPTQYGQGQHAVLRVYDPSGAVVGWTYVFDVANPGNTFTIAAATDRTPSSVVLPLTTINPAAFATGSVLRAGISWGGEEISKTNNEATYRIP